MHKIIVSMFGGDAFDRVQYLLKYAPDLILNRLPHAGIGVQQYWCIVQFMCMCGRVDA